VNAVHGTKVLRVRAIVFDLDGVLVDSMPVIRSCWTDWANRRGLNPGTVLADLHLTAQELIRKHAPDLDPVAESRATAQAQAQAQAGLRAFEGAAELLVSLPRNVWAVVTSGRRELALRHLALADLPVPDVLITGEDTARGKPDPAGYLLAAQRLSVPPDECLALEDSPGGFHAAVDAGMRAIAVTTSHAATDFPNASLVIDSILGLEVLVPRRANAEGLLVTVRTSATRGNDGPQMSTGA
jgi:mannitol-1-/sugar-/sorbitol-6-phosphatase